MASFEYHPTYSLAGALHGLLDPASGIGVYEREISNKLARKSGRNPSGMYIPAGILARDLTVGTATAGGHTVSTDLLADSFIELLRNRSVVVEAGARVLAGLVGNTAIPRQTSGATAYWVAESGAPTESQGAFDQVSLTPKTVGAYTDISRKLILQSSLDVSAFVASDLTATLAMAIDQAALNGTGVNNQPTGVINTSGVSATDKATAAATWADVVGLETTVSTANADGANMAYVISARMAGKLRQTLVAPGTGDGSTLLAGGAGNLKMNGHRVFVSNQIADGTILFGNWADLVVGQWAAIDINVDRSTHSTSGGVRIVALQDVDVAVRHAGSFAYLKNCAT